MKIQVIFCFILAASLICFSSCKVEDDNGPEPDVPCCGLNVEEIDFGIVPVGSARDSFITLSGCDEILADTVIMQCPGFHFIDRLTKLSTDTFAYVLDPSDLTPEDTCYIRFAPESEGDKTCRLSLGSDCDAVDLAGSTPVIAGEWLKVDPVVSVDLYDVWGAQCCGYWASGDSGTVLYRNPEIVQSWQVLIAHGFDNIPLKSVWKSGSGFTWTAGGRSSAGGGRILYLDGATWHEADRDFGITCYNAIWGSAACDMYFAGIGLMSVDGYNGKHWNCTTFDKFNLDMGLSSITGVFGSSSNDVWAVLCQAWNNVYHYNGAIWETKRETWMSQALYGVWVASNGEAFAVGANGAIYHFKGSIWKNESIPGLTKIFHGVWGRSESDVFAVGEGATIYHFNGSVWSAQAAPSGVAANLYSVWGAPHLDVYAVGAGGTIIRYIQP